MAEKDRKKKLQEVLPGVMNPVVSYPGKGELPTGEKRESIFASISGSGIMSPKPKVFKNSTVAATDPSRRAGTGFIRNEQTGETASSFRGNITGKNQGIKLDTGIGTSGKQETSTGLSVMFDKSVPNAMRKEFMRDPSAPGTQMVRSIPLGVMQNTGASSAPGPLNTFSDIIREKARQSSLKNNAMVNYYNAGASQTMAERQKTMAETVSLEEDNANAGIKRRVINLQAQSAEALANAPPVDEGTNARDLIAEELQNRKKNKLLAIQ